MKKQLQGLNSILFGALLILFSMMQPWIPILDIEIIALWTGLGFGIYGIVISLKGEE